MHTTQTKTQAFIQQETQYGAHNYHPLPVVLAKGKGALVWDVEGKEYYDFLSAYSAVNQGHCHPKIIGALNQQAQELTLTSRAFYNNQLGDFEAYATQLFGYDKLLPMNTGAEAVETAIKITRKWGYEVKGIEENQAQIIVCNNNFHGRTTTIVSFSDDADARNNFGPFPSGFIQIPYNDTNTLAHIIKTNPNVVGFLVEPIQGEAGVNVPDDDFLPNAINICKENNVLFIADEVQTGIARTGKMLATCYACDCPTNNCSKTAKQRPDVLILGKAISGGVYPVSAVLANNPVMNVIQPGQHGSTFGGNPLACAVAKAALDVVLEENLADKAQALGELFRSEMNRIIKNTNLVNAVRGKGLLNAILINDTPDSKTAWNICVALKNNGLLAKPTHGNIIRFAPPLIITKEQLLECTAIIEKTLQEFEA